MARRTANQRHRARVLAFEILYELDFGAGHSDAEAVLQRRLADCESDPPPTAEAVNFARDLVTGVLRHRADIDARIRRAAPAWPLEQMARIDVNILRLAIFEVLFDNRTPLKAAINEGIELAKAYGGDTSPRFVNGVLGAVVGAAAPPDRPPA